MPREINRSYVCCQIYSDTEARRPAQRRTWSGNYELLAALIINSIVWRIRVQEDDVRCARAVSVDEIMYYYQVRTQDSNNLHKSLLFVPWKCTSKLMEFACLQPPYKAAKLMMGRMNVALYSSDLVVIFEVFPLLLEKNTLEPVEFGT